MKIVKDTALPSSDGRRKKGKQYDYSSIRKMVVGDCAFFENQDYLSTEFNNARRVAARLGYAVTCRKNDDGMRMWRIE